MNNIAIVLSAGIGKRFGESCPKQFLPLNGNPLIYWSLRNFQESSIISSIIVVTHSDCFEKTKQIASSFSKVSKIISGGERRQDSVWNALLWINGNVKNCDKVFIHDAARPLFTTKLIDTLYESSRGNEAVIPAISIEDTIKRVDENLIQATVDRSNLVRVQTPQTFNFKTLYEAYSVFPEDEYATDDAMVMERLGKRILVIPGERNNLKITYPTDLKIAETLISM